MTLGRCRAALVGLLCSSLALGQMAQVTHNVNLRHDPSTDHPEIRLLLPPEQVQLVSTTKSSGYFHVRTAAGETGWVWSPNVTVLEGTPTASLTPTPTPITSPTPSSTHAPSPTPTPAGGAANSIDPSWDKPAPVEKVFFTTSGTCSEDGDPTGDIDTDHRKNRVDVPAAYHPVTFAAIAGLAFPSGPTDRTTWTAAQLAAIAPFEGVPVSVEAYILKVKVEGAEKCNCGFTKASEVDWHIAFVPTAHAEEKKAIVVETTPRIRQSHPKWTVTRLVPWTNATAKVRVSGWLMFDPAHPPHLGVFRTTLWEIHPITKIEVWKSGGWKELDSIP